MSVSRSDATNRSTRAPHIGAVAVALLASLFLLPVSGSAAPIPRAPMRPRIVYDALRLPDGSTARVLSNGIAEIRTKDRTRIQYRALPSVAGENGVDPNGRPDKAQLIARLSTPVSQAFVPNVVVVVFAPGAGPTSDIRDVPAATLPNARELPAIPGTALAAALPAYTGDSRMNAALFAVGTDRVERLFRGYDRATLAGLRSRAESATTRRLLPIENAYSLHIVGSSVPEAVRRLRGLPGVLYATADYRVARMNVSPVRGTSPGGATPGAAAPALGMQPSVASTLPSNYALQSSFQSLLNAPAVDAAAAYDEIERTYHQLPGAGEIITDVSLGDIDDATDPNDFCRNYVQSYGPTTHVIGGQRYIDWPSMPLIPAYVATPDAQITKKSVCTVDPNLEEVGLDFSMMAPLPHAQQRPGETGQAYTDLLGIAPGASYRLVVPVSRIPGLTDIESALLAAAKQSPRPNVMTASVAIGLDELGYPSRYVEDDPLMQSLVATIVHNYNIVVCLPANDGLRTVTNAAFGPSGGSAPTLALAPGGKPTSLDDIARSSVPSLDLDSGSIDVGGTTLDDIFAAPPQYAANAYLKANHTYAETRWTGFTTFSSGFGSRVNVSAPSDNVIALHHAYNNSYDGVDWGITGGTSASAPETAAAAAVALQVARLSGQPFASATAVRAFLASTGRPVAQIPQEDRTIDIGPQIDLAAIVETLLARAGKPLASGVARVAVEQRRDAGKLDGVFQSDTDARAIDLRGPVSNGVATNRNQLAWITVAPDWEALPTGATFSLHLKSNPAKILASTRYARLLPAEILKAAGQPLRSSASRTVELVYTTTLSKSAAGSKQLSVPVTLTFGPADATSDAVLAPRIAPVIGGTTIAVSYDLSTTSNVASPVLQVSEPGRIDPAVGLIYHPAYEVPLSALKGTVQVPVAALSGGGIYGIGIRYGSIGGIDRYSDFAFTRLAPTPASRPVAPLLAADGTSGHFLEIPFGTAATISWDVSNVPGATGAVVEVAAAGSTPFGSNQGFNNDNGTERDKNGIDSGSVAYVPVSGITGMRALTAAQLGLVPTLYHTIRVLPTAGSRAAGEASDYSSITEDGVRTSDGGFVDNGFGTNANGNDGFLTSHQATAAGDPVGSIESFDQRTNRITRVVTTDPLVPLTLGWGIFANDIGIVGRRGSGPPEFNLLTPAANVTLGPAFTPPATWQLIEAAANSATDEAAFLANYGPSYGVLGVFTADLSSNTFGPIFDISAPFLKFTIPQIAAFAEDTSLHVGVVVAGDYYQQCGSPTIAGIGLRDGKVGSITGVGSGLPNGLAVDSITHKVAVPTFCDPTVGIYHIPTRTSTRATLPGYGRGSFTAADPLHQRFLVAQTDSPDFLTNNNTLSTVYELDESGNVLESIERFNFFDSLEPTNANNLQLNPRTRTGYLSAYGSQQLEPFSY